MHGLAFEDLVDHYDAARPSYPPALFDALLPLDGADVLELGAGTGIASRGLLQRGARLTATDLGPRMLGRLHATHPSVPAVVCRAEALPFADGVFDLVCGAQMWHWVDVPAAAEQVARVLRPGGRLAVWWNDVAAQGERWWQEQQERLEAASRGKGVWSRDYRARDTEAELLATGRFGGVERWEGAWERTLHWPLYERWLRSKSYVQGLDDVEAFLAAERASLRQAFPDGVIREPFRVVLCTATVP